MQGPQGPKGDKGDNGSQGPAGVSGLLIVDGSKATTIPGCLPDIINPGQCFSPGSLGTAATCPAPTHPIAVSCVQKPSAGVLSITQGFLNTTGGLCAFTNFSVGAVTGEYYTRVTCVPSPNF